MEVAKSAEKQIGDWQAENELKYSVISRRNGKQTVALFFSDWEGNVEHSCNYVDIINVEHRCNRVQKLWDFVLKLRPADRMLKGVRGIWLCKWCSPHIVTKTSIFPLQGTGRHTKTGNRDTSPCCSGMLFWSSGEWGTPPGLSVLA